LSSARCCPGKRWFQSAGRIREPWNSARR